MKKITVKIQENSSQFFRFSGIASTESRDNHGEIIKQHGINLSLVKQGKAIVNAEHDNDTIGSIEVAKIVNGELYIEGIVFLKTIRAKKFYELLKKDDPNFPVTLSIEFVNPDYLPDNKSVLTEVILTGVALIGIKDTPANQDTYAELLKSISKKQLIDELVRRSQTSEKFKARLMAVLNRTTQL